MLKEIFAFVKQVFEEWNNDKVTRLAASLAYFTVFSLAPLLIVIIAVAGLVFGADVAQRQIVGEMQALIGPQGAQLIDSVLTNVREARANTLAALFGIVTIVLGATGLVGELKDSLNTIWNVTPKPGRGVFVTITERVLSLGMILAIGFMLLVSLVVSAGLTALGISIHSYLQQSVMFAQGIDLLISFLVVAFLFALLFKFLPDVRIAWRDVWFGAIITAILFTIGKYVIGLYLGNSNVATPFGAAGSLVILFVWIYYTAQILFLGAEITQVYANRYGLGIKPDAQAVPLSDAARVEQGTRAPTDPNAPVKTPPAVATTAMKPAVPASSTEQPTLSAASVKPPSRTPQYSGKSYIFAAVGVGALVLIGKLLSGRHGQAPPLPKHA